MDRNFHMQASDVDVKITLDIHSQGELHGYSTADDWGCVSNIS